MTAARPARPRPARPRAAGAFGPAARRRQAAPWRAGGERSTWAARRARAAALAGLLAIVAPVGAAAAEDGARTAPPETTASAAAIGRLNHAGYARRRHCTAFLLGPTLAATAAHCLAGVDPAEAHLLLGYDRMAWREHLTPQALAAVDRERDTALVCLDAPAEAGALPLARRAPRPGERVTVAGYGRPAVHRLQRRACALVAPTGPGTYMIDCGLSPGFSGAPVTIEEDDGPRVFGVVSRSARTYAIVAALDMTAPRAPC